jgi:uncharacterized protein DUF3866
MLKLRRARVVNAGPSDGREQALTIELDGALREAVADVALVGPAEPGDDVVVNVEARDLELGSGGFDIVHVNLSRGLEGGGRSGAHVMKLNYTSLQHTVLPVEDGQPALPLEGPVAVLGLHGQLAPVAWAYAQATPGAALGYIQTVGGALPGGHSRVARELRERGLLAGHLTAGAAFGGEAEAISTAGALHHGLAQLGWDAAICGPGPGIVGSSSALGHGGMSAMDSAHAALALGCGVVVVARMSSGDPRTRHRWLSHHTLTVLELLLGSVTIGVPDGRWSAADADLAASLAATGPTPPREGEAGANGARLERHEWRRAAVDLAGYAESGLPAKTMGRSLAEDPLFFAAALAGGAVLARLEIPDAIGRRPQHEQEIT